MSGNKMSEISKGAWLSRRDAGVYNPEEEDACRCMMPGYKCDECREEERREAAGTAAVGLWRSLRGSVEWPKAGLPRANAEAGDAARPLEPVAAASVGGEPAKPTVAWPSEMMTRPLEPVAAYTYEQARKMGEEAEKAPALAPAPAGEDGYYSRTLAEAYRTGRPMAPEPEKPVSATAKAFKDYPDGLEAYSEAEWNEVPETKQPDPFSAAWYNCVKKYRFIKFGGPMGGAKFIIEVELMGKTTLRHILKLSQVKGVLTKSSVHDTNGYVRIEEVIIDTRPQSGYAPEQLKFRFAGSDNALAFQLDLMSAL